MPVITAFFDGSCGPPNPGGRCAYGGLIYEDGKVIWECSEVDRLSTETSNNLAEYLGFLAVVQQILLLKCDSEPVSIFGDSQLVINQMTGMWKMKGGIYTKVAKEAKATLSRFRRTPTIKWIPRDQNIEADKLSKAIGR